MNTQNVFPLVAATEKKEKPVTPRQAKVDTIVSLLNQAEQKYQLAAVIILLERASAISDDFLFTNSEWSQIVSAASAADKRLSVIH